MKSLFKSKSFISLFVSLCILLSTPCGSLSEVKASSFYNFSERAIYRLEFQASFPIVNSYDEFMAAEDTQLVECFGSAWYNLYNYEVIQEKVIPSASASKRMFQHIKDNRVFWMTVYGTNIEANQINVLMCTQGNSSDDIQMIWLVYDISSNTLYAAIDIETAWSEDHAKNWFMRYGSQLYQDFPVTNYGIWEWSGNEMLVGFLQSIVESYE